MRPHDWDHVGAILLVVVFAVLAAWLVWGL